MAEASPASRPFAPALLGLMRKELLALGQDVHGLAALFLMPLLFIVVMTLALQNLYLPPSPPAAHAVLDRDGGAATRALLQRWQQDHGQALALPTDWQQAVRRGELGYVLEVEPGFSARASALEEGGTPEGPRIRLWMEPGSSAAVLMATEAALERSVGQLRARLLLAQLSSVTPEERPSVATYVDAQRLSSGPRPSAVQQNVPAWLVFGMFFVVTALGGLFVEERRGGALARLRTLGVGPGLLLVSKAVPYLGVNLLQAALMLAAGVWLMPALGAGGLSLQGVDTAALLLVLLVVSAAAVGLGLWLASLMRTAAQAHTIGPLVNLLMAAFGGVLVPTFVMPAAMQQLARLSPMHWALESLLAVLVRGTGVSGVLPLLLPLGLLALSTFAAAAWQLRRPQGLTTP